MSVSCDRNECQETAESMERKACDHLSDMVGQPVESISLGTCNNDCAYNNGEDTFYEMHNFSVKLKK